MTYTRNQRFWYATRHAFAMRADLWSKGSEAAALLAIAQAENWEETFKEYAPAGKHISPEECAAVILYRLLS
jgi:hypothetical protein